MSLMYWTSTMPHNAIIMSNNYKLEAHFEEEDD